MIDMIDILAFGAHPDDLEFGCGGILVREAAAGRSITLVDLTLGDKGTYGTPEGRRQESLAAAKVIGAKRVFLEMADCEIFDSYANRLQIVEVIRREKPRLVLAPYWTGLGQHPDHTACGMLVRQACRYARFAKILPHLPIHRPNGILHYLPPDGVPADFLIDVSPHLEVWKAMMACHQSQLQGYDYIDWNLRRASFWGLMIDKGYAQPLVKGNPVEIHDLMDISQSAREL